MKIQIFDTHKNVISAVVSTNAYGMLSVMINMADKYRVCSYRGSSLNLLALDDTDGAIPKHVCFVVTPAECDQSQGNESEVVVIAEDLSEEILLKGMHYENQCKEQHEVIFVPRSMLKWDQELVIRSDRAHNLDDPLDKLTHCRTCHGSDGSLPTHCPGRRLTGDEQEAIYTGHLDFIEGTWAKQKPPASLYGISEQQGQ